MSADSAPTRAPRLNPFAFPSETDSRFVLLVLTVVGSALFVFHWLQGTMPGEPELLLTTVDRCTALTRGIDVAIPDPTALPNQAHVDAVTAAAQASRVCWAGYNLHLALWSLASLAVFGLLTFAVYWLAPWWKIRRSDVEPLDPGEQPELAAALADLVREVGLKRMPTFLIAATRPTTSGLAFGRVGRRYVEMDGGLVILFYTDPEAFRAVILHELAHLRNGDVDKAYAVIAICLSFVVAAVLPFAALFFFYEDRASNLGIVARVLGLAVLVLALGAATLRAREVYADVRASVWDGPDGALRRLLEQMGDEQADAPLWRKPLQLHPAGAERRRTLDDTRSLFGLGFWDAFLTGAAGTVAFENVDNVFRWLTTPWNVPFLSTTVAAFLFAPLMTGIIGLGIWRMTFAAGVSGDWRVDLRGPSIGLAAGLFTGQLLSLTSTYTGSGYSSLSPGKLLWDVTLVAGVYLWLRWLHGNAQTWLTPLVGSTSPRRVYWTGLGIATVVLAFWLAVMYELDGVLAGFAASGEAVPMLFFPMLGATTWLMLFTQPLVILMLAALWALPLASALFAHRGAARAADWVYLDSPPDEPASPAPWEYRLAMAVKTGIAVGLLYNLLLLGIRVARRITVPEEILDTDSAKIMFFYSTLALAVAAQVILAAVVAARVRHLGIVHGLFAGFVAGCVMVVGYVTINLAFGGTLDADFLWSVFRLIVNVGTLAAIPIAAVVATVASRLRPRTDESLVGRLPSPATHD